MAVNVTCKVIARLISSIDSGRAMALGEPPVGEEADACRSEHQAEHQHRRPQVGHERHIAATIARVNGVVANA